MANLTENQTAVLTAIKEENTTPEAIAAATDKTEASVKTTLTSLVKKGLIVEGDDESYTLAPDNEADEETGLTPEQEAQAIHAQATDTMPEKKKRARNKPIVVDETNVEGGEEKPAKPEPVKYKGINVAEGIDPKEIEALEQEAGGSFQALSDKDKSGLDDYLKIGKFQYKARNYFASVKLFGQFLKENFPASQSLDPALRSNSTWLYGALHDAEHEDFDDLLAFLELDTTKNDRQAALAEYYSANPSVIKRNYKKVSKEREKLAKARESGYEPEEGEDENAMIERMAKEEKEREAKRQDDVINSFMEWVMNGQGDVSEKHKVMHQALTTLAQNRATGIDYMESVLEPESEPA